VPDADDTAGALLALHRLGAGSERVLEAAQAGIDWLLDLQNSDGGIPTFCRGWTKLPFDKSAPDLTAHMLGAIGVWLEALPDAKRQRAEEAMSRALDFLRDSQNEDGFWLPLWFGNQFALDHANPLYGTSRALTHLARVPEAHRGRIATSCGKALQWLLAAQNDDGGWGGAPGVISSIEETALAVDALADALGSGLADDEKAILSAVRRGADWLIVQTAEGAATPAAPIGLYFAKLWYFEALYPLIFSLSALGKAQRLLRPC